MQLSNFQVNFEEEVAYITIDHPPANALSADVLTELSGAIPQLEQRDDVKAVVITGKGKFFAAGADIQEFTEAFGDAQKGQKISEQGQTLCNQIEEMTKPVIAAINGHCLGGGLELAMACHLRFATEDAKMGLPELNLGLIPSFGGTQRLKRLTNKAKALEMILSSRPIKGKEAKEIGLVNDCYPEEQLMEEVKKAATSFATEKSSESVQRAIEAVMADDSFPEGLTRENRLFGELFETEDGKEGVHAFLEKRTPKFNQKT